MRVFLGFSPGRWRFLVGVRVKKLNTKPPLRRNRPTKVAAREMAKIRKVLGLPKREPRRNA